MNVRIFLSFIGSQFEYLGTVAKLDKRVLANFTQWWIVLSRQAMEPPIGLMPLSMEHADIEGIRQKRPNLSFDVDEVCVHRLFVSSADPIRRYMLSKIRAVRHW